MALKLKSDSSPSALHESPEQNVKNNCDSTPLRPAQFCGPGGVDPVPTEVISGFVKLVSLWGGKKSRGSRISVAALTDLIFSSGMVRPSHKWQDRAGERLFLREAR